MNKDTEEKIKQLQLIEQNMQNFMMQKQQFQTQLLELDSALSELKGNKTVYKVVGNIMVSADKKELDKELKEKKKIFELRIEKLEKQETKMQDTAKQMQTEVMKEIKND